MRPPHHPLLALLPSMLAFACGDDSPPANDTSGSTSSATGTSTTATDTETTVDPTETTTGESSSTTGPTPCTSNEECTDIAMPYCSAAGVCEPCNQAPLPTDADAACATADPLLPVCLDGTCVQCTPTSAAACVNPTPVCDAESNTCVLCEAHDECGPAACNLFTGACLPMDRVFEVGGPAPDYTSLAMALTAIPPDSETTLLVHPGKTDYNESVTVAGGRVVAFLAAELGPGIEPPRWIRSSGNTPQLTVTAGTTVLLDGLQLSGNSASTVPGLHVTGGQAWVDRSRIVQNTGGGIVADTGAQLTLRNCFVGGNVADVEAIVLTGSSLEMLYTTVVAGNGDLGQTSAALTCTVPLTVDVRNSVLVAVEDDVPEIDCAGADITFTASENPTVGQGNVTLGDLQAGWFVDLTSDFHLLGTHPVAINTAAQWTTTDPRTDIDGDPRPNVNNTADYAGADVPQ